MWVKKHLWLGGGISAKRDLALIMALVEKVRCCCSALTEAILFCTDGRESYITAVPQLFPRPIRTSMRGRPWMRP